MVALAFRREGKRKPSAQQHQQRQSLAHERGVDILTVRYQDEEDRDDGQQRQEDVWQKIRSVGKRATVLEALRRR
jgi:hypothetical protein